MSNNEFSPVNPPLPSVPKAITISTFAIDYEDNKRQLLASPATTYTLGDVYPANSDTQNIEEGFLVFTAPGLQEFATNQATVFANASAYVMTKENGHTGPVSLEKAREQFEDEVVCLGGSYNPLGYTNGRPNGNGQIGVVAQGAFSLYNSGGDLIPARSFLFWCAPKVGRKGTGAMMPHLYALTPDTIGEQIISYRRFETLCSSKMVRDHIKQILLPFATILFYHQQRLIEAVNASRGQLMTLLKQVEEKAIENASGAAQGTNIPRIDDTVLADTLTKALGDITNELNNVINIEQFPRYASTFIASAFVDFDRNRPQIEKFTDNLIKLLFDEYNANAGLKERIFKAMYKGLIPFSAAVILEVFSKYLGVSLEDFQPNTRGECVLTPSIRALLHKMSSMR